MTLKIVLKGGEGSGHKGHAGRPGSVGGSVAGIADGLTVYAGGTIPNSYMIDIENEWKTPPMSKYHTARNAYGSIANPDKFTANVQGLVVRDSGEFVGIASVHDSVKGDSIFINYMATKRSGSGYGRRLVREVAKVAVDRGLGLRLKSRNRQSDSFFDAIGFEKYSTGSGNYFIDADSVEEWLRHR